MTGVQTCALPISHAIGGEYKGKPLGGIGHLGTFSFHETKNIISGEGGLLIVNDNAFRERAEIIWEKGTNRAAFQRKEASRYNWVDVGSSFLPAEMVSAFLWAQLQKYERIQQKRMNAWTAYYQRLQPLEKKGYIRLPVIPGYTRQNGNFFYFITHNPRDRDPLLSRLNQQGIHAVFHYLPLHKSPFFESRHDGRPLPQTEWVSDGIVRLPFFTSIRRSQIETVCMAVENYYKHSG